jgi:phage anti-repressor protein
MKVIDFLKRYTNIDHNFIEDFYVFYDENKSEYDFVINIETIAKWLNVKKFHLKELLKVNFIKDKDYIETKIINKKQGKGGHNKLNVMLTYDCFKMLCMISRSEKSKQIREYYIEIEKHLFKYREEIIESLHEKIGIKYSNKKIMEENKKEHIIYVLKVDRSSDIYKIGKTSILKKRFSNYKVGNINEYEIVYVFKTKPELLDEIEKCIKVNLNSNTYNTSSDEIIKLDLDRIIETINFCSKKETKTLYAKNNEEYANKNMAWFLFIDKDEDNKHVFDQLKDRLFNELKKDIKKSSKKSSKKTSKKPSKKIFKKPSKRQSKQTSKKSSKKSSKKPSKRQSKQTSKQKTTTAKPKAKLGRPKKLTNHIDV